MEHRRLRDLLDSVRTIAIVGFSASATRASHGVALFLAARGHNCIGVNPALAGSHVGEIPVVGSLAALPYPVDMIDIFRASEYVGAIVDEALALPTPPRVIWMQLGVIDHSAKARAEAAGLTVVMDACPKVVLAA